MIYNFDCKCSLFISNFKLCKKTIYLIIKKYDLICN